MPEERSVYRLEIPLVIDYEIGLDPEQLSEHTLLQLKGTHSLQLCESLFWVVTQLSLIPDYSNHVYSPAALHEALEAVGQLGQSLAAAAGTHLQRLEHLVAKSGEGSRESADDST